MVKSINFLPVLVNTELREAYTWIELRNQIEQNLMTKSLFDQWNKEKVLELIDPFLNKKGITQTEINEQMEIIFKEIKDNDTIICIENEVSQKIIIAIIDFIYYQNFEKKLKKREKT
jgi:hypothetical protein